MSTTYIDTIKIVDTILVCQIKGGHTNKDKDNTDTYTYLLACVTLLDNVSYLRIYTHTYKCILNAYRNIEVKEWCRYKKRPGGYGWH